MGNTQTTARTARMMWTITLLRFRTAFALFISEAPFLFVRLAVAVGNQGTHSENDKGQNAHYRADVVILLLNGQFVEPGDKQVRVPRCGGQVGNGIAAGEQVDDVEVVHVGGKGGNQVGRGDVEHIGQGNGEELLYLAGPIHVRRLVQVAGDVLQNPGQLQERVGDANPDVDDNHRHPGPHGVGEEGQAGVRGNQTHELYLS